MHLIYWRIKYLKLKYGLSLLKIHEKYKKYIFRMIFYVSLIKNDTNKKRKRNWHFFKSLTRSNVFSTTSEEEEINLVWPNLCIFWLLFIYLYRSWSEEALRFAHDTHIASILSTTECLRFSLKMDFEVKTSC